MYEQKNDKCAYVNIISNCDKEKEHEDRKRENAACVIVNIYAECDDNDPCRKDQEPCVEVNIYADCAKKR